MKIDVIEFANRNGTILRGFFHEPDLGNQIKRKDLIIFPNGGLMGCEGDFRAYVRMARFFTSKGYYIFRFSPSGMGFSDGGIESCIREDLFVKIELGMFVDDITDAVEFIQKKMQFDSITLTGVCGGAISSFISASQIKAVNHVIPIGMPVILDSNDADYSARLPEEQAKFILKTYVSKFISPIAWLRFISGKSDWKTIKMIFNKIIKKQKPNVDCENEGFKTNPEFIKASRKMIGTKNILFIFGDTDWFYWEFENHFLKKYYATDIKRPFDTYLIKNGNHMLTWVEMQEEASNIIVEWINKKNNN